MNIRDGRTEKLFDQVARCEDIGDLLGVLGDNRAHLSDWKAFMSYLLDTGGYSYGQFAKLCGLSRGTIAAYCEKGLMPRSRAQFIHIGFAAKMPLDTLNEFLQRYGKYPCLYPKSIEDALYIFALHTGLSFAQAEQLQERYYELAAAVGSGALTEESSRRHFFETLYMQEELLSLQTLREFEAFVKAHAPAFLRAHQKLAAFIDDYIAIHAHDFADGGADSLHRFLIERLGNKQMAGYFEKQLSALRKRRIVPRRSALIVLGIHLDMPLADLNWMLSLAGMEQLCAKDKLESVLIYAIESAVLQNPDIELSHAMLLRHFSEEPGVRARSREIILRYEMTGYRSKEEDGGILRYVREALSQLDARTASEYLTLLGVEEAGA